MVYAALCAHLLADEEVDEGLEEVDEEAGEDEGNQHEVEVDKHDAEAQEAQHEEGHHLDAVLNLPVLLFRREAVRVPRRRRAFRGDVLVRSGTILLGVVVPTTVHDDVAGLSPSSRADRRRS